MRKVFITGAKGFIGQAIARHLRAQGVETLGVDALADPTAGVIAGDISKAGSWQDAVKGCDIVIHTAAIVSNAVDDDTTWRVNVLGTRRVVDAVAAAGVKRLVHMSSVRAFSDLNFPDGVDERWPVRTDGNAYVDTKIASEHVVLQAHAAGEISATIIRPGDVYGPGSRPWVVLPLEAMKSGSFALPAGGEGVFSPVFVDDLVEGMLAAAVHPDAAGRIFTLTGPQTASTATFFGYLHRMLGRSGAPRTVSTPVAVTYAAAVAAIARLLGRSTEINPTTVLYLARTGGYSSASATRCFGYAPKIDIEEGMKRTEAWLKAEKLI